MSRLARVLIGVLALTGCSTNDSDDQLANETCSWGDPADAHNTERPHICGEGNGDPVAVVASHFKPGSKLVLKTSPRPIEVTVAKDGSARTQMPAGLGIVPVEGVQDDGSPFRNGLTSLRTR